MKDLIFLISLLAAELFFCVTALLGVSYEGDSNYYAIYCIVVFVLSILFFLRTIKNGIYNSDAIVSLLVISIYIIFCGLSGYLLDRSGLCLVSFGIPATLAAIHYGQKGDLADLVKWLDFILIIMTISFPFLVMRMFTLIDEGVSSYSQRTSYYASFCFLINIFLLKYGVLYKRFPFAKTKLYRIVCFLLLPFQLLILFLSGGRGAFVVIVLGVVSFFTTYRGDRKKILRLLLLGSIITSLMLSALSSFARIEEVDTLVQNFERIFSVFDSDLDDVDRTSGRESVYSLTFRMIENSPIVGYGLFSYKKTFESLVNQPYPHNIILEWLIQGGMLLFIAFFIGICRVFSKCTRIFKKDDSLIVFLPILVYGFGSLLFSGSYMESPLFWFCSFYILNYKRKSCFQYH